MDEYDVTNITELAEIVKLGYQTAAIEYRGQKDSSTLNLPIFQQWLGLIPSDGVIVELGCGSGYPIAHHFARLYQGTGFKYIGVDISDEQIQMARDNLKGHEDNITFTVQEMLDWCRKQPDNSLHGFICLFSVFHLPRTFHVEFFQHVHRICKSGAPILFTIPQNPCEGFEDSWLGVRMYWSSFSQQWYEMTLNELGLEFLSKYKDVKDFLGEKETTWFFLYQKPLVNITSLLN